MNTNIQLTLIATEDNFQLLDIFIGGNGIADHKDLAQLEMPEGLEWRKGVVINGRAPIWLYCWLVHQCHPAAWVAVMDPRLGAVVIEVHHLEAPSVGSAIPLERIQRYLPARNEAKASDQKPRPPTCKVVAFVGPPNSGKSVLLGALYQTLQASVEMSEFQRDVFLLRACPDGEGNWFCEIPADLAKTLRFKNQWDDSFVEQVCRNVDTLGKAKRLLLVDVGGRIDKRNQQILNRCTHAVIVSRDRESLPLWRGALQSSELEVLAEIESSVDTISEIDGADPLRLRFGPLEREKREITLPDQLVSLFTLGYEKLRTSA